MNRRSFKKKLRNGMLYLSFIMAMIIFVLASLQIVLADVWGSIALVITGGYIITFCAVNDIWQGVKRMWQVIIKPFVWVDKEFKQVSITFKCETFIEAGELVETLRKHIDVSQFEMVHIGKE